MPSRETIYAVVLLVFGLVVGSLFGAFSPIFALPILALIGVGAFGLWYAHRTSRTRQMNEFRDQAERGVEFTARDQETLVSDEPK